MFASKKCAQLPIVVKICLKAFAYKTIIINLTYPLRSAGSGCWGLRSSKSMSFPLTDGGTSTSSGTGWGLHNKNHPYTLFPHRNNTTYKWGWRHTTACFCAKKFWCQNMLTKKKKQRDRHQIRNVLFVLVISELWTKTNVSNVWWAIATWRASVCIWLPIVWWSVHCFRHSTANLARLPIWKRTQFSLCCYCNGAPPSIKTLPFLIININFRHYSRFKQPEPSIHLKNNIHTQPP